MIFFKLDGKHWRIYNRIAEPIYFESMSLNNEQLKKLKKLKGVHIIRYIKKFDISEKTNFWVILTETPLSKENLSKNTYEKIKRAEKKVYVKQIDKNFLLENGYIVYKKTQKRYNKKIIISEKKFKKIIESRPDFYEYTGIFDKETNNLIGYSLNFVIKDQVYLSSINFTKNCLKKYCAYLYFYKTTNYYLLERNKHFIINGFKNLHHKTNIHDFLIEKFKYRKAYVIIHTEFSLTLKIILKLVYPVKKFIPKQFLKLNSLLLFLENVKKQ